MDFKELHLDKKLLEGLKKEKITLPTLVQEKTFQNILNKQNILIQSQTGTGKTLAYLLPIIQGLQEGVKGQQALILVPTHELALQVHNQIKQLAQNSNKTISSAVCIGSVNIKRQMESLKAKPSIVCGTTGRILELIKARKITAHLVQTIVIDEADKMLDKHNLLETKAVLKCCMRDVQTLMFSANFSNDIIETANGVVKHLEIIKIEHKSAIPMNIEHISILVDKRDKIETLRKLIQSIKPKKAIVFINQMADIEEATEKLKYHHYNAACIHGKIKKQERQQIIENFRKGNIQLLVATDIAARGLHFDNITTVFHVNIPEEPKDYLHRAGRSGRGNEKGLSVSIITKAEQMRIRKYQKAFAIQIINKKLYEGKLVRA